MDLYEALKGGTSEDELQRYLDNCQEGNKAFTRISRLDVEKAYQDYLAKKNNFNNDVKNNALSKEGLEIAKYRVNESRQEYYRARRDFAYAIKDRKAGGSERLSIDKNDVHKKIKHHKVEIDANALDMSKEEFKAYLDKLVISTTPVNPDASIEAVNQAKADLNEAKKEYLAAAGRPRKERVEARYKIDIAKEHVVQAKRDLYWFNYINKKLEATKKALTAIYENAYKRAEKAKGQGKE